MSKSNQQNNDFNNFDREHTRVMLTHPDIPGRRNECFFEQTSNFCRAAHMPLKRKYFGGSIDHINNTESVHNIVSHQHFYKKIKPDFVLKPMPTIASIPKRVVSDYETSSDTILKPRITKDQLNPRDVLCGRGSGSNDYEGNISYRTLICAKKDEYRKVKRRDKSRIASDIVNQVHKAGGRFLERSGDGGSFSSVGSYSSINSFERDVWYEVETKRAEVKTKQALRQHYVGEEFFPTKKNQDQKIPSILDCQPTKDSSSYLHDERFLNDLFGDALNPNSIFDISNLDFDPNIVIVTNEVNKTHHNVPIGEQERVSFPEWSGSNVKKVNFEPSNFKQKLSRCCPRHEVQSIPGSCHCLPNEVSSSA